jgi:sporulation protein YlmC with PRC-barrel domain
MNTNREPNRPDTISNAFAKIKDAAKGAIIILISVITLGVTPLFTPAHAENLLQTPGLIKIDAQKLSTGYRISSIIGSSIYNDNGDVVGTIDDLVISSENTKTPYVAILIGGFLGTTSHLIAVPYDNLRLYNSKIVLTDATKDGLKAFPEFKYASN